MYLQLNSNQLLIFTGLEISEFKTRMHPVPTSNCCVPTTDGKTPTATISPIANTALTIKLAQ